MPISATIITALIQFLQIIHSPMTCVHMETIQIFRWAYWEWSYPYSSRRSVPWSICFHHENWSDHNSLLFTKISCAVGRPGCHAPATGRARVTMKSHCQETWEKRNHCEPAPELLHTKIKSPRARQLPWLLIKLGDGPADPFTVTPYQHFSMLTGKHAFKRRQPTHSFFLKPHQLQTPFLT